MPSSQTFEGGKFFIFSVQSQQTMSRNAGSCKYVMEDCRLTDYTPNCQLNEQLKNRFAPGASSEYRYFLQHNACAMMAELRKRSEFENPSGCQCNYNHPPHDAASQARYSWQPSTNWLAQKYRNFNKPIRAPGGRWTNYC